MTMNSDEIRISHDITVVAHPCGHSVLVRSASGDSEVELTIYELRNLATHLEEIKELFPQVISKRGG
jgi:hypothetical protein